MGLNYDKYIKRLKAKRAENPEYAYYRQTMQQMVEPLRQMNYQMQGQMNLAGGSVGARAQAGLSAQQGLQQTASTIYGQADRSQQQRNDQLDNQIMGLEMQRDQQKDQQKDAGLKSAIQIGATALGAVAGSVIPGAGTLIGAQIGSAVGGIGSSFVGNGGQMGLNYVNPEELQQGIGDTIAGISAASTLKTHRDFMTEFGNKYQLMSTADKQMLTTFITVGDIQGAMEFLKRLGTASTTDLSGINTQMLNDASAGVGV